MSVPIPLVGPSYTNRSLPLSAQVSKNFYPEINPESRNIVSLNPRPGLTELADLGGPDRGMHVMAGVLFAVSGSTLFSVTSTGGLTDYGTVQGTKRCDFDDNGNQLIITTGNTAHFFDGALSQFTDTDLVNPSTVAYLNSQFLFDQNNGQDGEFITSNVGDGTSIDALSFAQAESHPDDILRIVTYNQLAYMFGSESIEPWFNSGVGLPPFDRVQGAVKPFGLGAKWSVAKLGDFIYFLDSERMPARMGGIDVLPIGNPALGTEWSKYDTIGDAIGFGYTLDQQNFYQINFPSEDRSWIYHEPSNSWHQYSYGCNDARHRASSYASVYGKHIVADHTNGKLYTLDFDNFTDDGEVLQRKRATAVIHGGLYDAPGELLFFDRVEFVLQTGEGIPVGQGSDPELMIRHSDDGGRTWSAEDRYGLGKGGEYLKRIELFSEGSAYQRIYELTISDPVDVALISANADLSIGA